ncbi:MAG: PAS domain-containing protein [Pseudomonadota bacterium]|nr:PAS domain-containing protein [Pseudomonadota bacterium]QKK06479.1 MAG: PAS domain-containing protein [Pseudomonadota bacterium]
MPVLSAILDIIVPGRAKLKQLARENRRLEMFLRAIPWEYCGWNRIGTQAVSPGFARMIGATSIDTVMDVQKFLTPDDAAALDGLYAHLAEYGEPFQLETRLPEDGKGGGRTLRLIGKRGQLPGMASDEVFDVIWLQDITQDSEQMSDVSEVLKTTESREKKWRDVLNALPFPLWLRNPDLDIEWCNKTYTDVLGEASASIVAEQQELPTTIIGKKGNKGERGSRTLARRALAGHDIQTERRHLVVDGKRRFVEVSEVAGMTGYAYDITALEEMEAQLKHHIATHHGVLEQLRTATAVFDGDMRLQFYNTAYEQLWDLDGKWLNAKPKLSEILDRFRENRKLPEQADFKKYRQHWLKLFSSLLEPYEEMLYLPDGTALRMTVVPHPMGGLIITYEDVTSRLELETSYNTLVAVQKETLDNLNEGLAVFGGDGCLKLWNPKFGTLWGLPPESLEGAPHITKLAEQFAPHFAPETWEKDKETIIQNGLERGIKSGRLRLANGTILEYTVLPLPDGNILNSYFDVTDEAMVENALLEKNAALEETERMKLDFLANVSYQLRTPLNAITGFAEILDQEYFGTLNERQKEYTEGVISAAKRLADLIDDILDLSTIEAGYLELTPAEMSVYALVHDIEDLAMEWGRKHNIHITTKCPKNIGQITADERRLKQVLMKLVSNAIAFSPDGGRIEIAAKKYSKEGHIAITVSDTGTGIAKEDMENIFSPFEKAKYSKHRRSGAGLGLSIVKRIVDLHGGDVKIESELGKGTAVTLLLPLAAATEEEKEKPQKKPVKKAVKKPAKK